MSLSIARNLIYHLAEDGCEIGHAAKRDIAWVENLPITVDLKRLLQWYWPLKSCQIGPITFGPVSEITKFPWIDEILECDLLPVGFGPSGDWFACDPTTTDCNIGFINHEKYGGGNDARCHYQATFRSLDSYLHSVDLGRYVPGDYYDACDYLRFLKKESAQSFSPPIQDE
ncbi:MAG TPA: SMI1/KNR4 family protein [Rhodopirellula baltica]|uniref:Knr4/Smi1-like domain-containing protein n=1 Tax=Rhodopirellula baltica (strain DSM 10527 / NCIMB 13988 / SH1) TaxID=243090 RepID=Q7UV09_RHOBA|nr:hypothetical protein [Rhodopirellula baltica]CAD72918.1 hypothetical protein RB2949 [Rhodopirellula baltica SH 1]HBE63994.1 SMI1/KNR4 family protein [Rhodopirellula baltica]